MVRLLVVDDDSTMRLILRRFFGREAPSVELVEVASGEEAIEHLRDGDFDCVLSDYRMNEVSGTDVLAYALKTRPGATRILMTGFADPSILKGARERAAIHEFIEKPMTTPELEALLRSIVVDRYLDPKHPPARSP